MSQYKVFVDLKMELYQIVIFSYILSLLVVSGFFQPLKNKIIFLYANPLNPKAFRAVHYGHVKRVQAMAPLSKLYFTDVTVLNICVLSFALFLSMLYQNFTVFHEGIIINLCILNFLFLALHTSSKMSIFISLILSTFFFFNNFAIALLLLYFSSVVFYIIYFYNLSSFSDFKDDYELKTGRTIRDEPIGKWEITVRKIWNKVSTIISLTVLLSLVNDLSKVFNLGFELSLTSYFKISEGYTLTHLTDYLFSINKSILIIPLLITTIQVGNFFYFFIYSKNKKNKEKEQLKMFKIFSDFTLHAFVFITIYVIIDILLSFSSKFGVYIFEAPSMEHDLLYRYSGIADMIIDLVVIRTMVSKKIVGKEYLNERNFFFNLFSKVRLSFATNSWVEI